MARYDIARLTAGARVSRLSLPTFGTLPIHTPPRFPWYTYQTDRAGWSGALHDRAAHGQTSAGDSDGAAQHGRTDRG